jgi:hypothetical protein
MFNDEQKTVRVIQDTITLLKKAMENLSSVINADQDPVRKKRIRSKARKELSNTITKHFS